MALLLMLYVSITRAPRSCCAIRCLSLSFSVDSGFCPSLIRSLKGQRSYQNRAVCIATLQDVASGRVPS